MKSSRNFKVGLILLVMTLAIGIVAVIAFADNNVIKKGFGGGNQGINLSLQNKSKYSEKLAQNCGECDDECLSYGAGNQGPASDEDGDGIPNGQEDDYVLHDCNEECDGTCEGLPKGSGLRKNSLGNADDSGLEYSVHISGMELKAMRIIDIAKLWGIDGNILLNEIVKEFNLKQNYSVENTINDLRGEYRFSPFQIKDIAQKLKINLAQN